MNEFYIDETMNKESKAGRWVIFYTAALIVGVLVCAGAFALMVAECG